MTVKPIYLDYMATTPVDPAVIPQMVAHLGPDGIFGNAASMTHAFGEAARDAVAQSRQSVASLINASPNEIIWTSGATESDNLAILGAARFYQRNGKHIITTQIEHKAVLDSCKQCEKEGFTVTYLQPDAAGLISPESLAAAIQPDTILVSVIHANNEMGVLQDIPALTAVTRPRGILFHVDAAQSVGKVPVDVKAWGVDLLSMSAHKIYGPKGVGALFVNHQPRVHLTPMILGGGHEQGLRSGTLATHQLVGMGAAFELAAALMATEAPRILALRERLWSLIASEGGVHLHGDPVRRLPGNLYFSVEGVHVASLFYALPELALSTTSACTSASGEPSHVLKALGVKAGEGQQAIRVSVGRFTRSEDIEYAGMAFKKAISELRRLSP